MNWNKDDRVALAAHPEFVGTVTSQDGDVAAVKFDGGGWGRFNAADLQREQDAPVTDKSWPPRNFETKLLPT